MNKPRAIYSIATKIGGPGLGLTSYNAVKALSDAGFLQKAVCYGNRSDIGRNKVLALLGNPAKILFFLPDHYYRPLKKGFLDYMTSLVIQREGCDVFHGWSHQALKSIKAAKKTGAAAVLECGSTHRVFREELLDDEYRRFGLQPKKHAAYTRDADLEEIALADHIFLISDFARQTFIDRGVDPSKLHVLGRGADLQQFSPHKKSDPIFRVLFVGRISIRKGIPYLLEAWKELNLRNAELILAGHVEDAIRPMLSRYHDIPTIRFSGFLRDPREAYATANIFVFPSLEDGGAKATYEAMASGLPLITTLNSGSVARDGTDGFVVPIRDSLAIKEKILYFYENPDEAKHMGENAAEQVKHHSWQVYRENLIRTYTELFSA